MTVHEHDEVSLFNCFADAFPIAKYLWHFIPGNTSVAGADMEFPEPVTRKQNGLYVCTAYNDLGSIKAVANLSVLYPPSCRLRKEIDQDGRLHLLCEVDSNPPNVTYHWHHNDQPLPHALGASLHYRKASVEGGQFQRNEGIVGTFSCEARNVVGLGKKCAVRVNGPVAALVAETDYTYLMFGGGSIVGVIVLVMAGVVICRKRQVAKFGSSSGRVVRVNHNGKTRGGAFA